MESIIDAAVAGVLLVGDHAGMIFGVLIAASAALAHIAAATGLDRLAAAAPGLHRLAEFLAGNWGHAVNAARLVQIYRRDGATAALAELDRLATAAPADPPS